MGDAARASRVDRPNDEWHAVVGGVKAVGCEAVHEHGVTTGMGVCVREGEGAGAQEEVALGDGPGGCERGNDKWA